MSKLKLILSLMVFLCVANFAIAKPFGLETKVNGVFEIGEIMRGNWFTKSKKIQYILDGEQAYFSNTDGSQILLVDKCCGGSGQIMNITLGYKYNIDDIPNIKKVNKTIFRKFVTNQGIYLGMPMQKILYVKGKSREKTLLNNGEILLTYGSNDLKNPILIRNNVPEYIELLYFKNDKLVKMEFGVGSP